MPVLRLRIADLAPRHVFRTSRGEKRTVRNVFVRIGDSAVYGYGEASPNAFYGESAETVVEKIHGAESHLSRLRLDAPADVEQAWSDLWPVLQPSRAAQCAVDLALWDLLARREGVSVSHLALGRAPSQIISFCTLGLSTVEELDAKLAELEGFPLIKLKSDRKASLEPLRRVRKRSNAGLAVDANCAWTPKQIGPLAVELAECGVLFIEQPLPPHQDDTMKSMSAPIPVLADESCVEARDVERMPGRFGGFNLKLVKCGGLTPALWMLRRGREFGLKVMVGCMLESSLLIAAGAVAAAAADYADLDGTWLIRDDPFAGLSFERGVLVPSDDPGFGVKPKDHFAW